MRLSRGAGIQLQLSLLPQNLLDIAQSKVLHTGHHLSFPTRRHQLCQRRRHIDGAGAHYSRQAAVAAACGPARALRGRRRLWRRRRRRRRLWRRRWW
jgi:hypothetical protein